MAWGDCVQYNLSTRFKDCKIQFYGKNNKVVIGNDCHISGAVLNLIGNDCSISIGNNVTINASKAQPTVINVVGEEKSINIGDNSLLSNNIEIHTSDYHGIYSKDSGERTNHDQSIYIGNNVWIGLRTIILKGTHIGNGIVVGAGTIVSGHFEKENSIIAGVPAKYIKDDIIWDLSRDATPESILGCEK